MAAKRTDITLMEYLAQRIVGSEHYTKRVLPTLDMTDEERCTAYTRYKAETYLMIHLYNWIRHSDIPLDDNVERYRNKTPWDLYAMTVDNTIEPLPQDVGVSEELFV